MNDRRLEMMPIAGIATATRNPKDHDIGELSKSIGRFGFADGLIFDERTQRLVAGHGRLEALRALQRAGGEPPEGITRTVSGEWLVPVQRGWASKSDADADAFIIAANRISEIGGWDQKALDEMLVELSKGGEAALSGVGFDGDDVDRILRELAPPPAEVAEPQINRAEELRKEWKVESGQLWVLGEHRLLCGDSTKRDDVDRVMSGQKASVCLTDPPYGLGATKASGKNSYDEYKDTRTNLEDLARKWLPIAREVAPVVCFSPGVTNAWIYPEASWVMCWFYGGGQLRSSWGFNCWQPFLCYGKDPSLGSGNGCRPDAVDMNTPANAGDIDHPCPKPTKLWAWLIERLSFDRTDTFYEPFSGSGTTIIACEQLGRKCRAIELSPGYVAVTLQRFKDATGKTPTLEGKLP